VSDRALVEKIYGFAFPDDLYAFHEFVTRHPDACEPFEVDLEGPLAVLAGKAPRDGWDPGGDWPRFYKDPPEFFTALIGHTDGLHWGYWFDAPGELPPVVADYFHSDGCELSSDGPTLFQAFRMNLELSHRDALDYMQDDAKCADDYREQLDRYAKIRQQIGEYALSDRAETGEKYFTTYSGSSRSPDAPTRNGMGIVLLDAEGYEELDGDRFDEIGWKPTPEDVADLVADAVELVDQGKPGAALKLGHDLWSMPDYRLACYEMLDLAYALLGRTVLRDYLKRAIEFRKRCDEKRQASTR
jgi:hypothetical protein